MFIKKRFKWGSATATTGETLAMPADVLFVAQQSSIELLVAVNLTNIAGTGTPSVAFAIQEEFGDGIFFTTATLAAQTAIGKNLIAHDIDQSSKGWPALGRGGNKQIVTTMGGTVTAVNADIYAVLLTPGE